MEWVQRDIRTLDAAEYRRYYALMTPEKRERVDRFRHEADRKRSVAADMLARQALARRCGWPEEAVVIDSREALENLLPRIRDCEELTLAMSGDMESLAVLLGEEVYEAASADVGFDGYRDLLEALRSGSWLCHDSKSLRTALLNRGIDAGSIRYAGTDRNRRIGRHYLRHSWRC